MASKKGRRKIKKEEEKRKTCSPWEKGILLPAQDSRL